MMCAKSLAAGHFTASFPPSMTAPKFHVGCGVQIENQTPSDVGVGFHAISRMHLETTDLRHGGKSLDAVNCT
jgi:hypothetical protein